MGEERKREERVKTLIEAFKEADQDNSGYITREEFNEALMSNDRVIEALISLGLENEKDLYSQFDADENGKLEFDEFFDGVTLMTKGQQSAMPKDIVPAYLRLTALQREL